MPCFIFSNVYFLFLCLQKYFPDKFAQRDILKIKVACAFPMCSAVVLMKDLKVCMCVYVFIKCKNVVS